MQIAVFDEIRLPVQDSHGSSDVTDNSILERRFLGSITVPFSAIYSSGRLEGYIKVARPDVLVGYDMVDEDTPPTRREPSLLKRSNNATYIKVRS